MFVINTTASFYIICIVDTLVYSVYQTLYIVIYVNTKSQKPLAKAELYDTKRLVFDDFFFILAKYSKCFINFS